MKIKICKVATSAFCVLLLVSWVFVASAQPGTPSEQTISQLTHEVSNEVLSPFCPGKTLAMCPSPAAADARRTIQELAQQGLTKEQIKDTLIERYGDEFRRVTPGLDDNMVVFILIIVALISCSVFVWFLTSSRRSRSKTEDEELKDLLGKDAPEEKKGVEGDDDVDLDDTKTQQDDYLDALRKEYEN